MLLRVNLHNRMKTSWLKTICCASLLVAVGAQATITITVGDHPLLPNTADQPIEIFVSGGDLVRGVDFNVQIADGFPNHAFPDPGVDGPNIPNTDLAADILGAGGNSTIFTSTSNNGTGYVAGNNGEQFANRGTLIDGTGTTAAAGRLVTLKVDTSGWFSGSWDLRLGDTINGSTTFFDANGDPVVPVITEGTITIVPEPSLACVAVGALLVGGGCVARLRRRRVS